MKRMETGILVALLMLFLGGGGALAAPPSVDINDLVRDTQRMTNDPKDMTFVWWLPEQFWAISLAQDGSMGDAQIAEFLAVVRPYLMLGIVAGRMGAFGGVTYSSEEAMRSDLALVDGNGVRHLPLPTDAIDANTRNLLAMMKPILANMLGEMGQNLHFVVFNAEDAQGNTIADATTPGRFTVLVNGQSINYELPLGSVLPPRFDPATGERFPGNYKFSPFSGATLVDTPPQPPQP